MKKFRRFSVVLCLILCAAIALAFVLENQQATSLFFLGLPLPQLPVSIFVLMALVVGMLIGPLWVLLVSWFRKNET
ncbi:hypothetical protein D9M71_200490 [compost metagenome]